MQIIYQIKISTPEKISISNVKHKILAGFYTCCVNLKSFKQELPKLLDCKMMSNFLKHPVQKACQAVEFEEFKKNSASSVQMT